MLRSMIHAMGPTLIQVHLERQSWRDRCILTCACCHAAHMPEQKLSSDEECDAWPETKTPRSTGAGTGTPQLPRTVFECVTGQGSHSWQVQNSLMATLQAPRLHLRA